MSENQEPFQPERESEEEVGADLIIIMYLLATITTD